MTAADARTCCLRRHGHEHAANGWVVTVGTQTGRNGSVRWWYSLDDTTHRRRPGYSSPARYHTADAALAAGRHDAEQCT